MFKRINWLLSLLMLLMLLSSLSVLSCSAKAAKVGDTVKVHYTGTLSDGTQFDSSVGKEPLEFEVGAGQMIKGFDAAIPGMKINETKTVTIPAADAYGERDEELVMEIDRAKLAAGMDPEVGDQLQAANGAIVTVVATSNTTITIDANHELAGEDLTFNITLVEIK